MPKYKSETRKRVEKLLYESEDSLGLILEVMADLYREDSLAALDARDPEFAEALLTLATEFHKLGMLVDTLNPH